MTETAANTRKTKVTRSRHLFRSLKNAFASGAECLLIPLTWMMVMRVCYSELGPDVFGIWVLAIGILNFGDVVGVGLTDATIKFVAKYRVRNKQKEIQEVVESSLCINAIMGTLVATSLWFAATFIATSMFRVEPALTIVTVKAIRICAIGLAIKLIHSVLSSTLQGFERYELSSGLGMVTTLLTAALQIGFVLKGFGLLSILITHISMLLIAIFFLVITIRISVLPGFKPIPCLHRSILLAILRFGFFSWIKTILSYAAGNMDHFLIAYYAGTQAVAHYAIAIRLIRFVHQLLSKTAAFLFPLSGTFFENKQTENAKKLYNTSSIAVCVAAAVLLVPLYVLSQQILLAWIGDAELVSYAAPLFLILCVRYCLSPVSIVNYNFLLGSGRIATQAIIMATSVPVILLAMWILTARWAAIGTAMGHIVYVPISLFLRIWVGKLLFKKIRIFDILYPLIPILFPMALASVCSFIFTLPLLSRLHLVMTFLLLSAITFITSIIMAWPMIRSCGIISQLQDLRGRY